MSVNEAQEIGPLANGAGTSKETILRVQTQYRLLRRLGAGGMAMVHLAEIEREDGFSRQVALKVVREDYAHFPEFMQMFAAEAALAAKLTHPNIVGVFDYCREERGRPFLVMELVNGISLRQVIHQRPPMPVPVAAFVLAEVLRGLGYAHEMPRGTGIRGLLHRDISPHNILLSWEGAVKISDFGIAKALMTTSGTITGSGVDNGKPAYMSPEQVGNQALDRRSDLFSLGVVFWEMLTGRKLFGGAHSSEIFRQIATMPIPVPSRERPIPRDLEQVAMKLLEKDRERRYARAEDALADLVRCRDLTANGAGSLIQMLVERCPPSTRAGAASSGAEPTSSATPAEESVRVTEVVMEPAPRRRGRPLRWVAGALAVLAAGMATWWTLREGSLKQSNRPTAASATGGARPQHPPAADVLPSTQPEDHSGLAAPSPAAAAATPGTSAPKSAAKRSRAAPKGAAASPATPPAPVGILDVRFDGASGSR